MLPRRLPAPHSQLTETNRLKSIVVWRGETLNYSSKQRCLLVCLLGCDFGRIEKRTEPIPASQFLRFARKILPLPSPPRHQHATQIAPFNISSTPASYGKVCDARSRLQHLPEVGYDQNAKTCAAFSRKTSVSTAGLRVAGCGKMQNASTDAKPSIHFSSVSSHALINHNSLFLASGHTTPGHPYSRTRVTVVSVNAFVSPQDGAEVCLP